MNGRIAPFDTLAAQARALSSPVPAGDEVELRRLASRLWRRRWLVLGSMVAAGLLVYLAVSQITPTYSAYSKVILDTRKAQIVTRNEVVADVDPSEQVVNGEVAILRSNLLLNHVVERLDPAMQDALDPAMQPPSLKDRIKGLLSFGADATEPGPAAAEAAKRQARLVGAVRRAVQVYPESNSFVMVVKAESQSPMLAMTLANTIARSYIALQLEDRRDAVGQATDWLEERLETLKADVEAAESAVMTYEAQSLITNGGTLENASQQLSDLNGQLTQARAESATAEARLTQLESLLAAEGPEAAARIVDTAAMQALRSQVIELRQQDAVWARSYGADQSRRVEIRNELAEIEAVMASEARNELAKRRAEAEIAARREQALRDSIAGMETQVMDMSQNRLQLRQLEREANAARMTYETLLTRITETRSQKELQQPDAKLIEEAILPATPSAPQPKLLAALAAVLAGTAVTAAVFFGEMTPTTYRTAREVEAATALPVLSSLPEFGWTSVRSALSELRKNPYGRYAERIRLLRTSLMLRQSGKGSQSLLILSSAPGEGKTTTALALAQMAALTGKSAIVVDCDLRRPRVAEALNVAMRHDFADFIENRCDLPDAITTAPEVGFDILGARAPRSSAADELMQGWLHAVVKELSRVYDMVIVDAPALLAVSDALALARVVDTRLYLVAQDDTPRSAVRQGLSQLSELGLHVTGMILNKVDPRRDAGVETEGYSYEA
jgi:uncharacterized protein involved in exopolysaccharide biosynthesis